MRRCKWSRSLIQHYHCLHKPLISYVRCSGRLTSSVTENHRRWAIGWISFDMKEGMRNCQGWGDVHQEKQSWVGSGVDGDGRANFHMCRCGDDGPVIATVTLVSSSLMGGQSNIVCHQDCPILSSCQSPVSCNLRARTDFRDLPDQSYHGPEESSAGQRGRTCVQSHTAGQLWS